MPTKKAITPAKIIEKELDAMGEIVYNETRAIVRVSKDRFDSEGNQIHEGGNLRDSIAYSAKGRRLSMSQLKYGNWQKPKELGEAPWNPPISATSELWDNPLATSIAKHIPETVKLISMSLIKLIVEK